MTPLGMILLGIVLVFLGCFATGVGAPALVALILTGGFLILGYAVYDFLTFDKE